MHRKELENWRSSNVENLQDVSKKQWKGRNEDFQGLDIESVYFV